MEKELMEMTNNILGFNDYVRILNENNQFNPNKDGLVNRESRKRVIEEIISKLKKTKTLGGEKITFLNDSGKLGFLVEVSNGKIIYSFALTVVGILGAQLLNMRRKALQDEELQKMYNYHKAGWCIPIIAFNEVPPTEGEDASKETVDKIFKEMEEAIENFISGGGNDNGWVMSKIQDYNW